MAALDPPARRVRARLRKEERAMMLTDKVAVVYGAGGGIGGAVARTFAREGARVFLTGRHLGAGRDRRQGDRRRRRIRRGGGGRRARRAGGGHASPVRGRRDGPRRHLVQRGRDPERGDRGCPADRARCRAVLPADHDLRDVVLPDRTPGGPADGAERVGGDHDRHRDSTRGRASRWWAATVRRRPPRRRSPEICRPSSHLRASAWSVCGLRRCRRHARSGTPSSPAPRHRG